MLGLVAGVVLISHKIHNVYSIYCTCKYQKIHMQYFKIGMPEPKKNLHNCVVYM